VWQVGMVVEKIKRFLDPGMRWNQAYENVVDTEQVGEAAEFRDRTEETIIHDTVDGRPAEITLAAAIDHITGCSWDFANTIRTILAAIGGDLHPKRPLVLHARNIGLNPARERMQVVCDTLRAYCEGRTTGDPDTLQILGEGTPAKRWLAASLEKTVRVQMRL